jgi:hypothetical protein
MFIVIFARASVLASLLATGGCGRDPITTVLNYVTLPGPAIFEL